MVVVMIAMMMLKTDGDVEQKTCMCLCSFLYSSAHLVCRSLCECELI